MLERPPTYRLVSWPVRLVVLVVALGAGWVSLETWASGIRLARMMSALGERNAAAELAAARAKRAAAEAAADPGEPGVIYIDPTPVPQRPAPAANPSPTAPTKPR